MDDRFILLLVVPEAKALRIDHSDENDAYHKVHSLHLIISEYSHLAIPDRGAIFANTPQYVLQHNLSHTTDVAEQDVGRKRSVDISRNVSYTMKVIIAIITNNSCALNERLSKPVTAKSVVEAVILKRQIVGLNTLVPVSECDRKGCERT